MADSPLKLIVVGSIGIDTVATPSNRAENILGGSASYACAAASRFASTGMVGVVGDDFPSQYEHAYQKFGIDLEGLQKKPGQTFRWSGVYHDNMDERDTLSTELNVFADFSPDLPARYREAPFLFLANIHPALQVRVLDQMNPSSFVLLDTMDLWINTEAPLLAQVISRVNLLAVNESEAKQLTGQRFLPVAAKQLLAMGPKYVLIKKGEHGSMLFSNDHTCLLPAYPLADVIDPTGAGDAFAGGMIGSLAATGQVDVASLREAMMAGSVVASFAVEAFSLERLQSLTQAELDERIGLYRAMIG